MKKIALAAILLACGCDLRMQTRIESESADAAIGDGRPYGATFPSRRAVRDLVEGETACTFVWFTSGGVPFVHLNQRLFECSTAISRITKRGEAFVVVIRGIDAPTDLHFIPSGYAEVPETGREVLVAEVQSR